MVRALVLSALLGAMPRACSCAGDGVPPGVETTTETTRGSVGTNYVLPQGVGPASGGGKCTVPELVEADVQVRDPSDASMEQRLFGTRTGELSVTSPEPCP